MTDSHLVRFSQATQALLLLLALLIGLTWVVPLLAVALAAASLGGPRWNLLAHLYRVTSIPPGEREPAAPPRFSQTLGAIFLGVATVGLFALADRSAPWWALGWGPALAVALLAAVAATTSL